MEQPPATDSTSDATSGPGPGAESTSLLGEGTPRPALKVHEGCLLEAVGIQFDGDHFCEMLHAGAALTTFGGRMFATSEDGQTEITLPIYAGTNSKASRNRSLGKCVIGGLPPAPKGVVRFEVRFTACEDGTLSIVATAAENGTELPLAEDSGGT